MNPQRPPQGKYRKVPDGYVRPVFRNGLFNRLLEPGEAPNRFRGDVPGRLIDVSPKLYKLIFLDLHTVDRQTLDITLTIEYAFDPTKLSRDAIVDEILRSDKDRQHMVFVTVQRVLRALVSQYDAKTLEMNPSAGNLERSIYLRIYKTLRNKGITLEGQQSVNVLEARSSVSTGTVADDEREPAPEEQASPPPEESTFHAPPPTPETVRQQETGPESESNTSPMEQPTPPPAVLPEEPVERTDPERPDVLQVGRRVREVPDFKSRLEGAPEQNEMTGEGKKEEKETEEEASETGSDESEDAEQNDIVGNGLPSRPDVLQSGRRIREVPPWQPQRSDNSDAE